MSDADLYKSIQDEDGLNKYYRINIVSNYKKYNIINSSNDPCYFCEKSKCENCQIPLDKAIEELLKMIPEQDNNYTFELEVLWHYVPMDFDMSRMNSCVDFQRIMKQKKIDQTSHDLKKNDIEQKKISI